MRIMLSIILLMLIIIGPSALAGLDSTQVWAEQRPLGQELSTYKPGQGSDVKADEASVIAEPEGVITLRQVLALALMHGPELKAYSWDVRLAEAMQLQAGLAPNPELDVEMENIGGTGQLSGFQGSVTTIQLSQLIELGDQRIKRKELASLETELAGWDYEARRLDVLTDVTKDFVELLAAQRRLALSEDLLRITNESTTAVTNRVEAGKDSPLEKNKAEVVLSNAKLRHSEAKRGLDAARKQLVLAWGTSDPIFERAAGKLDLLTSVPAIDELTELLENNPDVARWAVEINKSRAAMKLEHAKSIQNITLSGGMKRFNETDDNAFVIGFSIPLPISNRNQGGRLAALYDMAKSSQQQKAAVLDVHRQLNSIYEKLSNSYEQAVKLKSDVIGSAERVYEASRIAYSRGKLDYLHVLDAQRTLFEAQAKYIESLVAYHTAKADAERLIGQSINDIKISNK